MAYSVDEVRRRRRSGSRTDNEIEEGEFVPDHAHYSGVDDGGRMEVKRRRVDDVIAGSRRFLVRLGGDDQQASPFFPCPVCRREFRSDKAVHGHMRVHDPHGRQEKERRPPPVVAVSCGWTATGKRGSIGGRSVSSDDEQVDNSMAIAVSEPKPTVMDPMPLAFANTNNRSVDKLEAGGAETNPIVLAADDRSNQATAHLPAASLLVAHRSAVPPAAEEEAGQFVRWFACKEEGCNRRFPTHQGLDGHAAGHKNQQNQAAAAAARADPGAVACHDAKTHMCKECGEVFAKGVALGGHMRKHYTPKKGDASPSMAAEADAALPLFKTEPGMEEAAQTTSAPVSVVRVRFFGVDIVQTQAASSTSTVTDKDQSSASTNMH